MIAKNSFSPAAGRAIGAALFLTVGLSACGVNSVDGRYETTHLISVEEASRLIELPIDQKLDAQDERRLDAFAREYLADADGLLTIAYPKARAKESRKLVKAASDRLKASGVPAKRLLRGEYAVDEHGDRGVVLSYQVQTAYGAECPGFTGDSTRDYKNRTPRYFGCATQSNLAAMVDRPADLIEPRAVTKADAQRRQTVIERYRLGETTASSDADRRVDTRNAQ